MSVSYTHLDVYKRQGKACLRAKIDMASPFIVMRDPVLYRIKFAEHHQTGNKWCIYPMYDFTHCISDALEGITPVAYTHLDVYKRQEVGTVLQRSPGTDTLLWTSACCTGCLLYTSSVIICRRCVLCVISG